MNSVKRGERDFEKTLDLLQKRFFHNGGGPDAEEIWNRNKREVSEDKIVSLYATNSVISRAIKRNRKDNHSREGMIKLISRRRRLILYLKKNNLKRYEEIIKKLNLRK